MSNSKTNSYCCQTGINHFEEGINTAMQGLHLAQLHTSDAYCKAMLLFGIEILRKIKEDESLEEVPLS